MREALQPLVDDGTITAEQADAVVTQLKESLPEARRTLSATAAWATAAAECSATSSARRRTW